MDWVTLCCQNCMLLYCEVEALLQSLSEKKHRKVLHNQDVSVKNGSLIRSPFPRRNLYYYKNASVVPSWSHSSSFSRTKGSSDEKAVDKQNPEQEELVIPFCSAFILLIPGVQILYSTTSMGKNNQPINQPTKQTKKAPKWESKTKYIAGQIYHNHWKCKSIRSQERKKLKWNEKDWTNIHMFTAFYSVETPYFYSKLVMNVVI